MHTPFSETTYWLGAWNALAAFILVRAIAESTSYRFVFSLSLLAGTAVALLGSASASDSITFGIHAAGFALIGSVAALALEDRPHPRVSSAATLLVSATHIVVGVLAQPATLTQSLMSEGIRWALAGAIGILAVPALRAWPKSLVAQFGAAATLVVAISSAPSLMQQAPSSHDGTPWQTELNQVRGETTSLIRTLEEARRAGDIGDDDYVRRLREEALPPAEKLLARVKALADHDPASYPLKTARAELEDRVQGLRVVADVFAARSTLAKAQVFVRKGEIQEAEALLDMFWNTKWPILESAREKLENSGWRAGLDTDLKIMAETAIDMEIRQTESWLRLLHSEVVREEVRDDERGPASDADSMDGLAPEVQSREDRLESIASKSGPYGERLTPLLLHLARIRSLVASTTRSPQNVSDNHL